MQRMWQIMKMCILIFVAGAVSLQARTLEETVSKQFEVEPGGKVVVKNVNGRVIVNGWDQQQVRMVATKRVEANDREDAEQLMKRLKIEIEHDPRSLSIYTRLPRRADSWFGRSHSGSVTYSLDVPRNCDLRIETTNGTIEVSGVTGAILLETTNGKVTAREVGGELQIKTTNGSISADLVTIHPGSELDFSTTNGSIKVYMPRDTAFEVHGATTNGSIRSDFPVMIRGKYSSKRLEGKVNGGGVRLFLNTTNGSIAILER